MVFMLQLLKARVFQFVIYWRILHCVLTCSLELLFTLAELTLFQLLSRSMTSCGVAHFWLGLRGCVA